MKKKNKILIAGIGIGIGTSMGFLSISSIIETGNILYLIGTIVFFSILGISLYYLWKLLD